MNTAVVSVPFHQGVRAAGVGRGPLTLAEHGLEAWCEISEPARSNDSLTDVAAVNRDLAATVRIIAGRGDRPLIVAGNCNSCLGALAGIPHGRTGIVWLDAHGDFHTPVTSSSGFLDGMALAAAVGQCHGHLRELIGLSRHVNTEDVLLLGARDLNPVEERRLADNHVCWRSDSSLDGVERDLDALADRVDSAYLHVDVDFLDPSESPGVNFQGPGGVPVREGEKLIVEIARRVPLAAAGFTNYNPDRDPDLLTCQVILGLVRALREELSK